MTAPSRLEAETDEALADVRSDYHAIRTALFAIVAELRQRRSGAEEQRTNVQPSFTGIGGIVAPSPSEPAAGETIYVNLYKDGDGASYPTHDRAFSQRGGHAEVAVPFVRRSQLDEVRAKLEDAERKLADVAELRTSLSEPK